MAGSGATVLLHMKRDSAQDPKMDPRAKWRPKVKSKVLVLKDLARWLFEIVTRPFLLDLHGDSVGWLGDIGLPSTVSRSHASRLVGCLGLSCLNGREDAAAGCSCWEDLEGPALWG